MYKQVLALKRSFTARSSKTTTKKQSAPNLFMSILSEGGVIGGTVPCRSSGLEIFLGDSLLHVETGGSTILSEIGELW